MEDIWTQAKACIRRKMDLACFTRWIEPIKFLGFDGASVKLGCPNNFYKEWIHARYRKLLLDTLQENAKKDLHLELKVLPQERDQNNGSEGPQLSFPNTRREHWICGLNRKYTFDRFVVGPCNQLAYYAAIDVANSMSTRYNPLYVYSDIGLGKSHISGAIINHTLQNPTGGRICFTSAEGFLNELVQALRNNRIERFKEKFRKNCDMLVIDGVHFFCGKESIQLELSHTLDALINDNKKVVLTSTRKPNELPQMGEALSSRMGCGLLVKLKEPDFDTRRRILDAKAKAEGLTLPPAILDHLAASVNGNIRQLEGILVNLIAKSSLLNRPIDLELAKEITEGLTSKARQKPAIEGIQRLVAQYFNLSVETMISTSRKKLVYYPRQVAMYLCRQMTDHSLEAIGKAFNRDHASVIHSIAVLEKRLKTESMTRRHVEFLKSKLEGSTFL